METLHSHCAGLDIHQKEIVVCTYIGSSDEELIKEIRTFPTMTKNLYGVSCPPPPKSILALYIP
ncbi:TPA: hypothetical protein QCR51_005802 [Bacillus cereus]|nr:hypothetical protein [Bacillus cereus]